MSRDFPVKGLAELDKYLSHLPMNLQKGAYRAALTAAAKPVRDEARLKAPKKSGALAKGIKTGSARQNQDGTFSVQISTTGRHGFLGLFFEYGVGPHVIDAGDSGISPRLLTRKGRNEGTDVVSRRGGEGEPEVLKIGDKYVSGAILHPGFAPHPFMRPALDARAGDAVQAFAVKIREYIEGKTGFIAPLDEAA